MLNVKETIERLNSEHLARLTNAVLRDLTENIRDLMLPETAAALHTPLPPLAEVIAANGSRKRKAGKRTADEVARAARELGDYIAKNPGQRMEQIGAALGATTKELALPVKKLIASGAVRTRGQKRATVYLPSKRSG